MLSQLVWVSHRAGETGVDFYIRLRHAARDRDIDFVEEVWGTCAFRRHVASAGHVARLADSRLVQAVQWDNILPERVQNARRMTHVPSQHVGGKGPQTGYVGQ